MSNDLVVVEHRLVALLQGLHYQLLACELTCGEVLHVVRRQFSGEFKFLEGCFQIAGRAQLCTRFELALSFGDIFGIVRQRGRCARVCERSLVGRIRLRGRRLRGRLR